jgi:thiol:disulfide interchange protein DsbD
VPLALFVALAASAGSGLLAQAGAAPLVAQQDTAPRSEVRLVSDVASIRPGEPFTVGLHVTLDEGWRTPYKNAGDVGSGLIAAWSLPNGFSADSFAYPVPERISAPPVASYGYHDEVVILATITPPARLEAGRSVRLRLSADFVVCGHTCIPAHVERSLELPVRDAPPTASGDAALIRRYAGRLPLEHPRWTTRAARTGSGFVVGVAPPADWKGSLAGAYFFPADPALLDHAAGQPLGRTAAGEYRVRLTGSAYLSREPKRIEGVLVLPAGSAFDAAGHRGLVVSVVVAPADVAWAAEPTEPVAAPGQASAAGAAVGVALAVWFTLAGGVMLTPMIVPATLEKEKTT